MSLEKLLAHLTRRPTVLYSGCVGRSWERVELKLAQLRADWLAIPACDGPGGPVIGYYVFATHAVPELAVRFAGLGGQWISGVHAAGLVRDYLKCPENRPPVLSERWAALAADRAPQAGQQ